MTKSPFPLLDPIMLGPLLAYLNLYFGTPLPELYVVTAIAVRTHYFAGMYSYRHHEHSARAYVDIKNCADVLFE